MNASKSQFTLNKVTATYWRLTFNNSPINMLDAKTVVELQGLVEQFERDPDLKVAVFDSADPDFFVAHFDASSAAEIPNVERKRPFANFAVRPQPVIQ